MLSPQEYGKTRDYFKHRIYDSCNVQWTVLSVLMRFRIKPGMTTNKEAVIAHSDAQSQTSNYYRERLRAEEERRQSDLIRWMKKILYSVFTNRLFHLILSLLHTCGMRSFSNLLFLPNLHASGMYPVQ